MEMSIEIPADNDGYALLQCSLCGEYFKLTPDDCEGDSVLEIRCPQCGLVSDNYLTEDVIELAVAMMENYAADLIYSATKKWERQFKGGISFKGGKGPKKKYESPIYSIIDDLVIHTFRCCNKAAKINRVLKMTGSYCPFCGVREFELEQD